MLHSPCMRCKVVSTPGVLPRGTLTISCIVLYMYGMMFEWLYQGHSGSRAQTVGTPSPLTGYAMFLRFNSVLYNFKENI